MTFLSSTRVRSNQEASEFKGKITRSKICLSRKNHGRQTRQGKKSLSTPAFNLM